MPLFYPPSALPDLQPPPLTDVTGGRGRPPVQAKGQGAEGRCGKKAMQGSGMCEGDVPGLVSERRAAAPHDWLCRAADPSFANMLHTTRLHFWPHINLSSQFDTQSPPKGNCAKGGCNDGYIPTKAPFVSLYNTSLIPDPAKCFTTRQFTSQNPSTGSVVKASREMKNKIR